MFNLEHEIDRRLAALKLAKDGKHDPQYDDIDVSKDGIRKTLQNAGIMDENGEWKELKIG